MVTSATLVVLILVVACAGQEKQESTNQQGPVSGDSASTSSQSSQEGAGSSSGQSNRACTSGRQTSSAPAITGINACASYSWLAQTGAGGFSYESGDGSRVDSSKSPPSDFAAEVGRFAEDSLEEVLDGNVSPTCFIESKTPDGGSVYGALSLPSADPTGVASAVGEAMKKRGANVLGSYNSTSHEGTFDIVTAQGLPVETPNNRPATGRLHFITTQEGDFQVVMLASYTDNGGQVSSGNSSVPAAPSGTLSALPAPTAMQ